MRENGFLFQNLKFEYGSCSEQVDAYQSWSDEGVRRGNDGSASDQNKLSWVWHPKMNGSESLQLRLPCIDGLRPNIVNEKQNIDP